MKQKSQPIHLRKAAVDLLLIFLLSFLAITYFLRHNPEHLLIFDDSYITLRFAANFFKYRGITYDGSTFLSGATSPLHIIFIALLGLFMEMEEASLVIGVLFFFFSSLLVYLWTFALYNNRGCALLGGVLMSTSGWLIFDALNGLETTTFICLSLLTFYLYYCYEHKPFYTIPLVLSILTRPEGWFIAGALFIWEFIKFGMKNKKALRTFLTTAGLFMLLITPYGLLSFYCTGSLLPGTAFSKAVYFGESSIPVINKAGCFINGLLLFYKTLLYPALLLLLPVVLCASKVISLTYLWLYYGIFCLIYFLFFPCSIKHYWCRYQHIFIPMLILALSGGAFELLKRCRQRTVKISLTGFIALAIIYNQSLSFTSAENTYKEEMSSTRNTKIALARWLKDNTPAHALIALHDIGAVGYFSERNILDLVGLVNPEVTRYYLDQRSNMPLSLSKRNIINYLKEKRPDYLVMFPEWDKFFNVLHPANKKYFRLIYTTLPLYPTEMRYHVYECNWTL